MGWPKFSAPRISVPSISQVTRAISNPNTALRAIHDPMGYATRQVTGKDPVGDLVSQVGTNPGGAIKSATNPLGFVSTQITGKDYSGMLNPISYLGGNALGNMAGAKKEASGAAPIAPSANPRDAALQAGYARGQQEFYDDPDMQRLRQLREQMAKGYDSEELGALRGSARSEIAGQRAQDQRQMASQLARGGVGGARGAAMQNAAAQKSGAQVMDAERKMALDSANMKRQGTGDLQDFLFRQKYGKMGTGISEAQLQSADYQAEMARQANNQKKDRGLLGDMLQPLFG